MQQILLIENDKLLQALVTEELMEEGYMVRFVSDCIEALSMINNTGFQPDLIILDVRLSQKDYYEVIKCILKYKIDIPHIIHTNYSAWRKRPLNCADAYEIKSHDLSILKAAIYDLLQKQVHNQDKAYERGMEYA